MGGCFFFFNLFFFGTRLLPSFFTCGLVSLFLLWWELGSGHSLYRLYSLRGAFCASATPLPPFPFLLGPGFRWFCFFFPFLVFPLNFAVQVPVPFELFSHFLKPSSRPSSCLLFLLGSFIVRPKNTPPPPKPTSDGYGSVFLSLPPL